MSSSVLICFLLMIVTIGDHHEQEAIPFQGHFTLESSFRFRVISRWTRLHLREQVRNSLNFRTVSKSGHIVEAHQSVSFESGVAGRG